MSYLDFSDKRATGSVLEELYRRFGGLAGFRTEERDRVLRVHFPDHVAEDAKAIEGNPVNRLFCESLLASFTSSPRPEIPRALTINIRYHIPDTLRIIVQTTNPI